MGYGSCRCRAGMSQARAAWAPLLRSTPGDSLGTPGVRCVPSEGPGTHHKRGSGFAPGYLLSVDDALPERLGFCATWVTPLWRPADNRAPLRGGPVLGGKPGAAVRCRERAFRPAHDASDAEACHASGSFGGRCLISHLEFEGIGDSRGQNRTPLPARRSRRLLGDGRQPRNHQCAVVVDRRHVPALADRRLGKCLADGRLQVVEERVVERDVLLRADVAVAADQVRPVQRADLVDVGAVVDVVLSRGEVPERRAVGVRMELTFRAEDDGPLSLGMNDPYTYTVYVTNRDAPSWRLWNSSFQNWFQTCRCACWASRPGAAEGVDSSDRGC